MEDRFVVRWAGALLALGVVVLVLAGAMSGPEVDDNFGPTDDSMGQVYDQQGEAKASGAMRLVAAAAGLALVALGHSRLRAGFGRSLFTLGGAAAAGCFGLAALARLVFSEPDFSVGGGGLSVEFFAALARLADTVALMPAGLALLGFAAAVAPDLPRPSVDAYLAPARVPQWIGGVVVACGLSLAITLKEEGNRVDTSWFRPGGAFTVVGSLLVLAGVVVAGALLDSLRMEAAGAAAPEAPAAGGAAEQEPSATSTTP